jgi:predicted 2-oxoglutarate/Fe(II)-dependent dioxygenase YbiX/peroxiredoxin
MRVASGEMTKPTKLTAGDRAPNFVLPNPEGKFLMLYERVRGNPFVLVFCAAAANNAELAAFTTRQSAFAEEGIDLFLVVDGPVEAAAALAREIPPAAVVLADPKGAITAGYREAAGLGRGGTACLLLDANQRVIDRRGEQSGQAEWALRRLRDWRRVVEPLRVSAVAPVLIVPAVLEPELCDSLIRRWETEGHEEGTVSSVIDGVESHRLYDRMKRRRDHQINDQDLLRHLVELVGRRVAPELEKAFGFRGFRFDRFIVTCYAAERGDHFARHRDNMSPSTANRRFALTLNLNDGYEGGELMFPEYGPHRYRPERGGAILFSCSLLHEALPVTRGERYTLLSFLRDPAAQQQGLSRTG